MQKNNELQDIINQSSFSIQEGIFVYTKVASFPKDFNHFLVTKDATEITVITKIENLSSLDLIERNKDDYKLIALNVSVPFYSVGFLAQVSTAIAQAGMNILIVSTYSKDYILVKAAKIDSAKKVLLALGFKKKS